MIKRVLVGMVCFLLLGCGFHLRGFIDMPSWLNNVAIVIQNGNRDLDALLKKQLESYSIKVIANPLKASYLLIIESDSLQQQMTNVAASTAPRQYLLTYDVQFTVAKVKGPVIIPSRHVVVTRQLTVNNNRVLGSNYEETQLINEMRRDATMQIINQLSRENKLVRPDNG